MAIPVCLQDWITLTGSGSTLIQPASQWVEIPAGKDAAVYTEISGVTNASNTNLYVQTAPTRDENFYAALETGGSAYVAIYTVNSGSGLGPQQIQTDFWQLSPYFQRLARFARWKIVFPSGATNITFRIWLSLNQAQGGF